MPKFGFVDVAGTRLTREEEPDWCPICHHACDPQEIDWRLVETASREPGLEIVYQCPRRACGRLFIARYRVDRKPTYRPGLGDRYYRLFGLVPRTPRESDVPQEVNAVSPSFASIYNEAQAAESYGLGQVAGAGYRKSLEFLVKDYCSAADPENAEAIKQKFLGRCIQDHVTDERVRECARRASWLGNDEVHYTRKWESKDVEDLKILIQLTVGWIHSDVLTKKYLEDMD
jgi:hypothetical protein